MSEPESRVRSEIADRELRVTIARPEAKNALTKSMYKAIKTICEDAVRNPQVDVVVIQGSSGAFATGGDLKEMLAALESGDPSGLLNYEEVLPFEALRVLPKPTVAKIDGLCLGGGLTLALMCDVLVASDTSRFAIPEAKVGIVDGHLPRLLREAVPAARLRYWTYTGAMFGAAEARDFGLLTHVVPAEELDAAVEKVVGELKASSSEAIAMLKRIFNEVRPLSPMTDAYFTMIQPEVLERLRAFRDRK